MQIQLCVDKKSVIAATAENYDYSKNDDPGAVVVEKMAQAVVIHKMYSSKGVLRLLRRSLTSYANVGLCDTSRFDKNKNNAKKDGLYEIQKS